MSALYEARPSFLAVLAAAVLGLVLATGSNAEEVAQAGAKELFFARNNSGGGRLMSLDPPTSRGAEPAVAGGREGMGAGLSYWIELQGAAGSEPQRVTESRIFRDGDRIRIHVVGNRDGYISVLQVGASGEPSLLYPLAGAESKAVVQGETTILPAGNGWFRFDGQKGVERIFLVSAPSRQLFDSSFAATRTLLAAARPGTDLAKLAGAKDLIVEVEQAVEPQVGTYLVSPAGEAIVFEIRLNHQ